MSGREKPDAPGLWRDANEKTVVACMESGELAIRDADTGEILSAGQLEQAAPFQRTEWKGIDLTRAGFSAMPRHGGMLERRERHALAHHRRRRDRRAHLPAEGRGPRMGMRALFRHHREDAPRMGPVGTLRLRADG